MQEATIYIRKDGSFTINVAKGPFYDSLQDESKSAFIARVCLAHKSRFRKELLIRDPAE